MATPASKLSREVFKKMISGNKGYLPTTVSKELKSAGMSKLLHSSERITKNQALKALRHLQEKGMVPKVAPASALYNRAGLQQVERDAAARAAEAQVHIKANIRIDVGEEISAEDRGERSAGYDPRSVLGKRVIDEVDKERDAREKKVKTEQGKHDALNKNAKGRPQMKNIIQRETLPDMDIG